MTAFAIDLSGTVALVTGAGAGSGRAIALSLAGCGAAVAAADLNIERADATSQLIHSRGGTAIALRVDISNRFQAANMIEQTRDAFGQLRLLVNAASICHVRPLLQVDEWEWRRQLEVNLGGLFFCMQLAARVLADEGGGAIINVLPAEALATLPAGVGAVAGAAGVIGLTRQAARELAEYKIRVNAIAAGDRRDPVTNLALFLASQAANSISGQLFYSDRPYPHWS
ncbi:MAG: SDR family NAD(P)-dependent oxidoreductase [Chloroflexi bacterium]|nr:SDR family NAD(P)-dependent oxidoreductase [Chloroflexota bacterium]MCY4247894.1 SDR family NAD(P)-dependent oxidoreductase [Chloroflexota bacterium]